MGTEATDFITHPVPVGSYGVGSEVPLCKTYSLYSKAASFLYWHFKKIQQYLKKNNNHFLLMPKVHQNSGPFLIEINELCMWYIPRLVLMVKFPQN